MGDRANCVVLQDNWGGDAQPVYLYTHWNGTDLLRNVQTAMQKRWRWDDPAYLTRIIFDTMTDGEHGGETGYGIATSAPDNEHLLIVVDSKRQEIKTVAQLDVDAEKTWSFEDFCKATIDDLAFC